MAKKYPDLRKKFKVGDRVCYTYHYKKEPKKKYCGTVKTVIKDALDVKIDGSPHGLARFWDYAVYDKGPYHSPMKKVKK